MHRCLHWYLLQTVLPYAVAELQLATLLSIGVLLCFEEMLCFSWVLPF